MIMYKYWLKYREDLVSLAKITSTIIAIASFLGFSLPEKFPPTPCQPTAIVETTEVSTNN
jgi:hypothetical protein